MRIQTSFPPTRPHRRHRAESTNLPGDKRVALITGASSGIGAAIARELGARGYRIALAARRRDALETVAHEICTNGGQALPIVCDVTQSASIATCVERTLTEFGSIDVLVNNAGIMHTGPIVGADVAQWQEMIDINLVGLMRMTHAVLPHMIANGGGHIVNMSSVAGKIVRAGSGVYNVTKWGVNVFSEALRQEVVKDHIKVTTIGPGVVETELLDKIADPKQRADFKHWAATMTPLTPADVAHAVAYALEQPEHVVINDVVLRPAAQDR